MHRTLSNTTALAALILLTLSVQNAQARPYTLQVDPTQSVINWQIQAVLNASSGASSTNATSGLPPVGGPYTTGAGGDLQDGAPVYAPGDMTIAGGGFNVVDNAMVVPLEFIGSLNVGLSSVGASIGPIGPVTGVAPVGGDPGTNMYDLGGLSVSFNTGVLTYTGTGLVAKLIGTQTMNFASTPLNHVLPAGTMGTMTMASPAPFDNPLTLSIPLSLSTIVTTLPIRVDAFFTGTLVLTGVRVAEPGTIALMAIGLVGLFPVVRKRMRQTALLVAATAAISLGSAQTAEARPYTLQVDPTQSVINWQIQAVLNASSGASSTNATSGLSPIGGPYTTGAGGDLQDGAPVYAPGDMTIAGGGFNVVDNAMVVPLEFIGSLNVGLSSVGASIGPIGPVTGVAPVGGDPGTNMYDLGGLSVSFNTGVLTYTGTGLVAKLIGTQTMNFASTPLNHVLPAGTMGQMTMASPAPFDNPLTLSIPLSLSTIVTTLPIRVDAFFTGTLVLTGVRVAEPGTIALMGIGLVGLVPVVRKRLKKHSA